MSLEAATPARRIGIASSTQCLFRDVRHEVEIREGVFAGAERHARRLALQIPLPFWNLPRPPQCPDVMKLERIDVHHHESVASFALEYPLPPIDIPFHPEMGLRLGVLGHGCLIRQLFEQRVRPAVGAAPRRLARAARALDDDDHARQPICLGRGSTNGVGSRYRFGYGIAEASAGEFG